MLKQFKFRPAHLWLIVAVIAIAFVVWGACQKDPKPVTPTRPTVTAPQSVTSDPTDAEIEALKRLQEHKKARKPYESLTDSL